ncbi:hypothetical protein MMC16_001136 [Acarospora aff. strigata]|nr:hypothetical protein [Acarospora aff. strigata]
MSTFTISSSIAGEVPVHLTSDLTKAQLLSFPAFKNWISTLEHSLSLQEQNENHTFHASPYKLRKIDIQSVDFFGSGKLGFVKLKAEVSNDKGEKLPGSVFLRGGSVGMMLILQPDDVSPESEEDKHVILAVQPRIPAGSLSLAELPAGMIDDSGEFSGAAAKEIKEETGLDIPKDQLIELTKLALPETQDLTGEKLQQAVYPSPGGSDEFVPIFLHQKRVKRETLKEWQGKLTGLRDEGEKITLKLVPLDQVWKEGGRDAKVLASWALYHGLRREGAMAMPSLPATLVNNTPYQSKGL